MSRLELGRRGFEWVWGCGEGGRECWIIDGS